MYHCALVRLRLFGPLLAAALCSTATAAALPNTATAARVLVLGPGARTIVRDDPFLSAQAVTPAPSPGAPPALTAPPTRIAPPAPTAAAAAPATAARRPPRKPRRTTWSELTRLYEAGSISNTTYVGDSALLRSAVVAVRRLKGARATQLEAVLRTLDSIAAAGQLTPSRLPALFLTLARNLQWWTTGPLLSYGQRVEFAGSQLVWEYYPGQGIQLQELGNFGKADGLLSAGAAAHGQLQGLLSELIPLAASRAGGLTWEYYFNFDGGRPPWTSAMSQATALEALTRAYKASGDRSYLAIAHRALALFTTAPPLGVFVKTPAGARYLQYSFAPATDIINAFLQSLIGLYDYAQASADPEAAALFAAGNAQAQLELPHFDTGAWSLYQPGSEDTLGYHELVTGFLQELCQRTSAPAYCVTAAHFSSYLRTPPTLQLLTSRARIDKPAKIYFRLSKYSHVGIVVSSASRTVLLTSAYFPYGIDDFSLPALKAGGTDAVRLAATDLAGNFARIQGTLTVTR